MGFWLAFKVSTELIAAQRHTESPTVSPHVCVMWVCVGRREWERGHETVKVRVRKKKKKPPKKWVWVLLLLKTCTVRRRLAWTPWTLATTNASPRLLRVLSLHHVPAEYTTQPQVCPHHPGPHQPTARRLSEPFGYPVKLMRCDWVCAASAQAIVPFIWAPLMYGDFPSSVTAVKEDPGSRVCVCRMVSLRIQTVNVRVPVCIHLSVRGFASAGAQRLVCHSGKDNHQLADGKNVSRWTVCVCVCVCWCMSLCLGLTHKGSSASWSLW